MTEVSVEFGVEWVSDDGHRFVAAGSAPCDRCGSEATWLGDPDCVYPGGTVYEVACPACGDTTGEAQPESRSYPRLEPLNLPPVSVTRLVLWRLMNAALNRRAS